MSTRIHKEDLRRRLPATTGEKKKEEKEETTGEEEKEKKNELKYLLKSSDEPKYQYNSFYGEPAEIQEPKCVYVGLPAAYVGKPAEIQEVNSNFASSSYSHPLEVVSEIPPVEQEVERAKTSAAPSPTRDKDSATTEDLKLATKFSYFATAKTEELKQAIKFSYFATALAGGGIVSLLIFHLESNSGEPHSLFFKALTSFVLATFVSGLSIILLTICAPPASYQKPIIRGLVSATLVFLTLMGVGVSIVLLKTMSELAFVPVIVVVIVACILVHCMKTDLDDIGCNDEN